MGQHGHINTDDPVEKCREALRELEAGGLEGARELMLGSIVADLVREFGPAQALWSLAAMVTVFAKQSAAATPADDPGVPS